MAGNYNNAKAVRTSSSKPNVNLKGVRVDTRGMSLTVVLVCFACLAVGVLLGGFGLHALTKDDCFEMNTLSGYTDADIEIGGESNITDYLELGVTCVSFGKDISADVKIEYLYREDISHEPQKVTAIDPDTAGIYYVIYTTSNFKYKNVQLIRNVIVYRTED